MATQIHVRRAGTQATQVRGPDSPRGSRVEPTQEPEAEELPDAPPAELWEPQLRPPSLPLAPAPVLQAPRTTHTYSYPC